MSVAVPSKRRKSNRSSATTALKSLKDRLDNEEAIDYTVHHHLLVDRCVAKYFDDGILYEGKVEYYDKPYFHVVYQDGDGADYIMNF